LHVDPGKAAADVRAAYALDATDGSMPAVGAALADGLITAEHAGSCVKAAARLPKRLQEVQVSVDPPGRAFGTSAPSPTWSAEACNGFGRGGYVE
jgi:hypothetical protein